jgi:hypothetical protein
MATTSGDDTAGAVYDQLARTFPPSAIEWVKTAHWDAPADIPLHQIDLSHADTWAAGHDGELRRFARKARKARKAGRRLKPVILVRTPGAEKDIVVDGHHRVLGELHADQATVYAYVAHVDTATGGWDELHSEDLRGQSGHRAA